MPVTLALLRIRLTRVVDKLQLWFGLKADDGKGKDEHSARPTVQEGRDAKGEVLRRGSLVKANWRGKGQYYTGYVDKVNSDGTSDLQYDDGDYEHHVKSKYIERIGSIENVHPLVSKKDSFSAAKGGSNEHRAIQWLKGLSSTDVDATFVLAAAVLLSVGFLSQVIRCVFHRTCVR